MPRAEGKEIVSAGPAWRVWTPYGEFDYPATDYDDMDGGPDQGIHQFDGGLGDGSFL